MRPSAALRVDPGSPPPASRSARAEELALWWLGQAGFLLEWGGLRVLVDPYLSDSLAEKYRGSRFPHARMMAPPVAAGELRDIDLFLSTHGHTDHLDPGTIGPVAAANPRCAFVVPSSCASTALERGVPPERLVAADAFRPLTVAGFEVFPVPSAHEELAVDSGGRHKFLGYVLERSGLRVYHSGDCCPYAGLAEILARRGVDLGLLPVNGRDAERSAAGIAGNFTVDEVAELARSAGFGASLGHHYGMFDFNTVDPDESAARLAALSGGSFRLARVGERYCLARAAVGPSSTEGRSDARMGP